MRIEKTIRYDKFRTIKGNRELNTWHLSRLVEAILDNNLLEANPIIVNDRMEILDGQHRLEAARRLGIPIYYVVVRSGSIQEIQMLNSNVRGWSMQNFLDSYVERGNLEYIELKKFMDITGLSLGVGLFLTSGALKKSKVGRNIVKDFKDGDFKANQKDFAYAIAKDISRLSRYCEDDCQKSREFISALIAAYRAGIKFETLIEKLESSGTKLKLNKSRKQYIRQLEDVLSWKSKVQIRIS